MKVIIGSKNPVKSAVTKRVFDSVFSDNAIKYDSFAAQSGVSDQPYDTHETKTGAYNRALACQQYHSDADYCVGLEGGIDVINGEYWVTAWMCVLHRDGLAGYGRTSSFMLPEEITKLLKEGKELGDASDIVFGTENSKHQGGAVGLLTDDEISREDFYVDALRFALIPFRKPEFYLHA